MKAVILAGGMGSRISEETDLKPKPMVEIGGRPILWHIMKIFSAHGIHEFIICLGYKGYLLKEYFSNYLLHTSDVTFDLKNQTVMTHPAKTEPWTVTLVDTGKGTMTGGRLKRVQQFLGNENFCFTYGDGVGDVNITQLIAFHKSQKKLATVTAVRSPSRFGSLQITDNKVIHFKEKPPTDQNWISGGFFVLSPQVLNYIEDDQTIWEGPPLERLAQEDHLSAYLHTGFWQPMDTLRDKNYLEELWKSGKAPWKVWE